MTRESSPLLATLWTSFAAVWDLGQSDGREIVAQCGFTLHFSHYVWEKDVEHFFRRLKALSAHCLEWPCFYRVVGLFFLSYLEAFVCLFKYIRKFSCLWWKLLAFLPDCHLSFDFAHAAFSWPNRSFVIFMQFELIHLFLLWLQEIESSLERPSHSKVISEFCRAFF